MNRPVQNQVQKSPARNAAAEAPKRQDVAALMTSMKTQILAALPKHMTVEKFTRIMLTEVRGNPQLEAADQTSFLGALMTVAQLGLEPGRVKGEVWLIPFKNNQRGITEVSVIPGFRGLMKLAKNSGEVRSIRSRIVRERDFFEFQYGDDEKIVHRPYLGPPEDAGEITYVYAIAELKDGEVQREVMSVEQVNRIRDRKKFENPVWGTDYEEMARKTVVRRLAKYLPMSTELAQAIDLDDAVHNGKSQENWTTIDVSYDPRAPAHDPSKITDLHARQQNEVPAATQQAQDADRENALAEFKAAVERVRAAGGNPETIMRAHIADVVLKPASTLIAAADVLNAWKPQA